MFFFLKIYLKILFKSMNILTIGAFFMQIYVSNVIALTCKASVGGSCTGATYCKATYQSNGSQWIVLTQNCIWTTLSYPQGNNWFQMITNGVTVATHTCTSKDYCNIQAPPPVLPTVIPTSSPSTLQCIRKFFGGSAQSCTATSCYIVATLNFTLQNCAPAAISALVAAAPGQHYCARSIDSLTNKQAMTSTLCYCHEKDQCNDNALLQWGLQQLVHVTSVNCHVGLSLSSETIGTATGQYCQYMKTTYSGKSTETWSAISSTLKEPPFGCIKVYGNSNPSVTCTCNSDYCNVNPLQSTTPATTLLPSAATTPLPTAATPLPTTSTTPLPTAGTPLSTISTTLLPSAATPLPTTSTTPLPTAATTTLLPSSARTKNTMASSTILPNQTATRMPTTLVTTTTQKPASGGALQILLMNFDNSDGGGRIFDGSHCDPFWFTGIDQCDIALRICIEPSLSSPNLDSCSTAWIDLNQISNNENKVDFAPGVTYGGFNNPMTFYLQFQQATGFHLKFLAQDVDNGDRQEIDKYSCSYSYQSLGNWGTITGQHHRPAGFMTLYDQ